MHDAATSIVTGRFEPIELNSLTRSMFEALVEDPNAFGLGERINEYYASIQRRRPIETLGHKCGMDSPDAIAVDLRGNVMTCQTTGPKGEHKIGHVADFDVIALNIATHFAFRSECIYASSFSFARGPACFLRGSFQAELCQRVRIQYRDHDGGRLAFDGYGDCLGGGHRQGKLTYVR